MIMQVDVKYIKTLKLSLHKKIMCASMEAMESWTDGMVCILIFNGSSDSLPAGIVLAASCRDAFLSYKENVSPFAVIECFSTSNFRRTVLTSRVVFLSASPT